MQMSAMPGLHQQLPLQHHTAHPAPTPACLASLNNIQHRCMCRSPTNAHHLIIIISSIIGYTTYKVRQNDDPKKRHQTELNSGLENF